VTSIKHSQPVGRRFVWEVGRGVDCIRGCCCVKDPNGRWSRWRRSPPSPRAGLIGSYTSTGISLECVNDPTSGRGTGERVAAALAARSSRPPRMPSSSTTRTAAGRTSRFVPLGFKTFGKRGGLNSDRRISAVSRWAVRPAGRSDKWGGRRQGAALRAQLGGRKRRQFAHMHRIDIDYAGR
jgi:hypothetical protein